MSRKCHRLLRSVAFGCVLYLITFSIYSIFRDVSTEEHNIPVIPSVKPVPRKPTVPITTENPTAMKLDYNYSRMLPPSNVFGRGGAAGVENRFSGNIDKELDHIMEERRQKLQQGCRDFKINASSVNVWLDNLYVDAKHKFVFCMIPKVTSTNWKMVFSQLYGLVKPDSPLMLNKDKFWVQWLNRFFKRIKKLDQFSLEERKGILDNYAFGMVARHPIERLASAHRDKFQISYYQKDYGRKILKNYRKNPSQYDLQTGKGVTFEEFVRYLLDAWDKGETFEYHWQRQYELCTPCSLPFKYVAHFETANRDCSYMLNKVNVSAEEARFGNMGKNYNRGPSSDHLVKDLLATLTEHQRKRLFQIYEYDFHLLGY